MHVIVYIFLIALFHYSAKPVSLALALTGLWIAKQHSKIYCLNEPQVQPTATHSKI
jgi:disulfide bond formation protein DsbB